MKIWFFLKFSKFSKIFFKFGQNTKYSFCSKIFNFKDFWALEKAGESCNIIILENAKKKFFQALVAHIFEKMLSPHLKNFKIIYKLKKIHFISSKLYSCAKNLKNKSKVFISFTFCKCFFSFSKIIILKLLPAFSGVEKY